MQEGKWRQGAGSCQTVAASKRLLRTDAFFRFTKSRRRYAAAFYFSNGYYATPITQRLRQDTEPSNSTDSRLKTGLLGFYK